MLFGALVGLAFLVVLAIYIIGYEVIAGAIARALRPIWRKLADFFCEVLGDN